AGGGVGDRAQHAVGLPAGFGAVVRLRARRGARPDRRRCGGFRRRAALSRRGGGVRGADAGDGDRYRRGGGAIGSLPHPGGEGVGGTLAVGEGIELPVGVVGKGAIAVVGDLALGAFGVDSGDREGIAVGIAVVGQDIAGGEGGVLVGAEAGAAVIHGNRTGAG